MYERQLRNKRIQRKREIQTKITLMLLSLCIVLVLAVIFGSFLSKAQSEQDNTTYYKYFDSIQIEKGDTLWSIAERYMGEQYTSIESYVEEVMEINSLEGDNIVEGYYLIVPYFSNEFVGN